MRCSLCGGPGLTSHNCPAMRVPTSTALPALVPSMQRYDPVAEGLRAEGAAAERARIVEWLAHKERWKDSYACMADGMALAEALVRLEHLTPWP